MLEAVAAGCLPVVPDRLSYPEIYPPRFRYASLPLEPEAEAAAAAALVRQLATTLARGTAQVPDISAYGRAALQPRYQDLLARLAGLPG